MGPSTQTPSFLYKSPKGTSTQARPVSLGPHVWLLVFLRPYDYEPWKEKEQRQNSESSLQTNLHSIYKEELALVVQQAVREAIVSNSVVEERTLAPAVWRRKRRKRPQQKRWWSREG